jgi:hypothetical protein
MLHEIDHSRRWFRPVLKRATPPYSCATRSPVTPPRKGGGQALPEDTGRASLASHADDVVAGVDVVTLAARCWARSSPERKEGAAGPTSLDGDIPRSAGCYIFVPPEAEVADAALR